MTKYILKRILIAIPTLLGITMIDYAIMCFAGSPLEMLQGARISQEAIAAKEAAMGLDKPFYIQYFIWLGQLLSGNMGYSVKSYEAVSAMIGSHLGPTLLLMGVSLIVSLIMSVPAGIYSAIHQYSKGDYAVVTASFFGSSIPGFFLSLLLVYLFTVNLGILPSGGMTTLGTAGGAADVAAHMVMPVLGPAVISPSPWQVPISGISAAPCWKSSSRTICAQPGPRESGAGWSYISTPCAMPWCPL